MLTRFMSKRDCEVGTLAWYCIAYQIELYRSGLSYVVLAGIN